MADGAHAVLGEGCRRAHHVLAIIQHNEQGWLRRQAVMLPSGVAMDSMIVLRPTRLLEEGVSLDFALVGGAGAVPVQVLFPRPMQPIRPNAMTGSCGYGDWPGT